MLAVWFWIGLNQSEGINEEKKMNRTKMGLAISVGLLVMQSVQADSLQCGTNLVSVGDEEYTLLEKCGEPSMKEGGNWIYNQGQDNLVMVVEISDGKVQSIRTAKTTGP
ncbi:MAG: DUF2845 domain-containing protein [Proteobacteria bacterium]|nr:DUF2845 domain-containing protein [Pseudomonadota bacterium]